MKDFFIESGFTEKEASIYLCVLGQGEIPISLVARRTSLKRTTAYATIEHLKNRGILSFSSKKGIQYVSALSPEILLRTINENASKEITSLQKRIMESKKILPELLNLKFESPLKPRIRFFDGQDGIKQILREFSQSKAKSMGFSDYEQMPEDLLRFIREEVIPQRKKLKNKSQFIVPNNAINKKIRSEDKKFYTEHKVIHFQIEKNPIELLLFDDNKVAFVSFVKNEQFGLVIDSEAIHKTLKNIFSCIWQLKR